jgi:hypothetical protein
MSAYTISCHDCDSLSTSDWLRKAVSDADWHNTMTGHDSLVTSEETGAVEYDLRDVSETCEPCDRTHWVEDQYGNETRIDCGNGCDY